MFAHALYKFAAFLAQRVSLPTARRFAAVVGRLTCLFQRRNRRHLHRNLTVALGDQLSDREIRRLRLKIYANFARFVTDFLWLPRINRENLHEFVTEVSAERFAHLAELCAGGTPVILLAAHIGNWELGAVTGALLGHPLTALVDVHPSPQVTRFFNQRRAEKGVEVVTVESFHKCFRAMKRRSIMAIVGDRPVTGQGIHATYFGREALVPDGHALLARRFGATIVPAFLVMQDDGRYELILDEPIVPRVTDDEEADIRECVDRCLRVFERYIREYRDQWYVFRPIWREPGAVRATREDRLRAREDRRNDRLRARAERRARVER